MTATTKMKAKMKVASKPPMVLCGRCQTTLGQLEDGELICRECVYQRDLDARRKKHAAVKNYDFMVKPIRAAIDWACAPSTQKKGALIQHHGIYQTIGPYQVQVADRVIVFSADGVVRLTKSEVARLRKVVKAALGSKRVHLLGKHWNGVGCDTVSFPVSLLMPTIEALVARYHKGCPAHKNRSVFCDCGWFERGRARAKLPEGWT